MWCFTVHKTASQRSAQIDLKRNKQLKETKWLQTFLFHFTFISFCRVIKEKHSLFLLVASSNRATIIFWHLSPLLISVYFHLHWSVSPTTFVLGSAVITLSVNISSRGNWSVCAMPKHLYEIPAGRVPSRVFRGCIRWSGVDCVGKYLIY